MPAGPLTANTPPAGTEHQLATAIVGLIRAAQSPLILVGTEVQRYGLADKVADLIAKLGVRWATALLAKSALAEQGAGWIGVYDPPYSQARREKRRRASRPLVDARLRIPQRLCGSDQERLRPHGRDL
jgi:indolepyruvate decarboxylase